MITMTLTCIIGHWNLSAGLLFNFSHYPSCMLYVISIGISNQCFDYSREICKACYVEGILLKISRLTLMAEVQTGKFLSQNSSHSKATEIFSATVLPLDENGNRTWDLLQGMEIAADWARLLHTFTWKLSVGSSERMRALLLGSIHYNPQIRWRWLIT